MRLLKREKASWYSLTDYNFNLTEFTGNNIPKYAILSHTWGKDGEEVTFNDVVNGTGKSKAGYKKLKFCGEQAAQDGLLYFWVDTCCIDKSNNTELQEAINSMFRWYRSATKCYVYLSDVLLFEASENRRLSQLTWESDFQQSRWFTRGWTLQELIAPESVEFFSLEGKCLGDKKSLEQQIQERTGIFIKALRGGPLSEFSVDERMSWATKRETTREEDTAYSLMGIFDIHMPLIYGEGRKKAIIRLQKEIQQSLNLASLSLKPLLSKDGAHWIVPFDRNPLFTGREYELARLNEKLFAKDHTTKIAVTGLGGVGKTQLVLELLYRTKDEHKQCSIIWIPATDMESLHQAYLDVARQLGIPGWQEEQADVKKLVQGYLSEDSAGPWIVVFDNADNIDMWIAKAGPEQERGQGSHCLINYLPRSRQGSIVFTTRDRKTAIKLAHQSIVEVPEMYEEEAALLLQNYLVSRNLVNNRKDTSTLLEMLTCLPLAIAQAAAYINENGIELADYLSILLHQEKGAIDLLSEEFEDDRRYRSIRNPVATTWLISFEQIQERDPLAAEYLSFMACVNPKDIPQSLLPPGPSKKKEMDAIGTLTAYSFIGKRPTGLALDLHRLVHLAMRNWLRNKEQLAHWTIKAIERLEVVFPNDDYGNRSMWRGYLPHTCYVLISDVVDKDWEKRIDLAWRSGMCLFRDGRCKEAEVMLTEVMESRKRKFGKEHPDTLISMANLASTCRTQGRWKEAEELEVQVMETSSRLLGEEHPDTLTSMANLASTYWNQGRWKGAEELQVQVMETSSRLLGAEHPHILNSMANLALTYSDQGRWKEAEELQVQVMEIGSRLLGAEHPDTLTSMANLALTYGDQGRWKEAEELLVQVMEISSRLLGEEHPDTLTSMANLASTYKNQGRWKEAEELQMQVMETRKRLLGKEHPDTLTSMANLASTYWNQGRWKEAEELLVQVMETSSRLFGAEHPNTLTSIANLASTYWNQGRWKEAEELQVQMMEISSRLLGAEHPDTLTSMANLALTYWNQGRWKEAEELQMQVMEIGSRLLGPEHPNTLTSIANLALTYGDQGRWKEAEELLVQVKETRKRLLGGEHPDTLTCMNNLAFGIKEQGRDIEAIQLMAECVQLRNQVLGAEHPYARSSAGMLAEWQSVESLKNH